MTLPDIQSLKNDDWNLECKVCRKLPGCFALRPDCSIIEPIYLRGLNDTGCIGFDEIKFKLEKKVKNDSC